MNTIIQPDKKRFIVDTVSLISYFPDVFHQSPKISNHSISLIDNAFRFTDETILIIPSIVFVEIFDKWFRGSRTRDEEFRAKFNIEVFGRIQQAPNIEIREVDREVLEMHLTFQDPDISLENHDALILASAAVLDSPLITSDADITKYVKKHKVVPYVIS